MSSNGINQLFNRRFFEPSPKNFGGQSELDNNYLYFVRSKNHDQKAIDNSAPKVIQNRPPAVARGKPEMYYRSADCPRNAFLKTLHRKTRKRKMPAQKRKDPSKRFEATIVDVDGDLKDLVEKQFSSTKSLCESDLDVVTEVVRALSRLSHDNIVDAVEDIIRDACAKNIENT
eukprot:Rmarinus@m.1101